jgi:dephospho-CoA kinase
MEIKSMRILSADNQNDLREAGGLLRGGHVVAIPGDTGYFLAADAANPSAVARMCAIKGGADRKPLPVLAAGGIPLAFTNANRLGEPPVTSASEIGFIGLGGIIDSGRCAVARLSAAIDPANKAPQLLRHSAAVIGITGGSGSGKSAVTDRLKALGAAVIRADETYHRLLRTDEAMLSELRERFFGAFDIDGAFDRAAMRDIAFGDRASLADLNRITHPYVIKDIRREMAEVFLKNPETPIAVEAIALIGSGADTLCTVKAAVTAPFEKRAERIMYRDGLTREDALKRLVSQKNDDYYINNCDVCIENDGSFDELNERVDDFWAGLVRS